MTKQKQRLEYLRGEIENERISYEEIAELQSLVEHIDPDDTVLLEWAGVPEFDSALRCTHEGCNELQTEDGEFCEQHYPTNNK